jgi:hypothetical protein
MPLEIYSLAELKAGLGATPNQDRPYVLELIARTVFEFHTVNQWGKHAEGGSCRAAALKIGAEPLFGRSVKGEHHAEEDLVRKIQAANWHGSFDYMYVDIEPCHSGRYAPHECKALLWNTFDSGKVYYAWDQDQYETGLNMMFRRNDVQDQILMLQMMAGYEPEMIPLGRHH